MKEIILAKYGEIILKGGNRPKFENILMNNIRNSLKNVAEVKARLAQATIYVEVFDEDKMDIVVERLSKIFGIVSITRAVVCEKDIEDIKAKAKEYLKKDFKDGVKFKVEAKRSDKQFIIPKLRLKSKSEISVHTFMQMKIKCRDRAVCR